MPPSPLYTSIEECVQYYYLGIRHVKIAINNHVTGEGMKVTTLPLSTTCKYVQNIHGAKCI